MKKRKKQNNIKLIIATAVVIIVLLGSYLVYQYQHKQPQHPVTTKVAISPTPFIFPSPEVTTMPEWTTYKDRDIQMMFNYPKKASAAKQGHDIIVMLLGSAQTTPVGSGTDLTDGYYVDFTPISLKGVSLEDFAAQAQDGTQVECYRRAYVSPITSIEIAHLSAKTFSTKNCLGNGDSIQYYIPRGTKGILQVTVNVAGTDSDSYLKEVQTIVSSMWLL